MRFDMEVSLILSVLISTPSAAPIPDRCRPEDRFPHAKGSPIYYTCQFPVKNYDAATTPSEFGFKYNLTELFNSLRYVNHYATKKPTTENVPNFYESDLYHYSVKFHSESIPEVDPELDANFDNDVQWNYEYLTRIFPGIAGKSEPLKKYNLRVTPSAIE